MSRIINLMRLVPNTEEVTPFVRGTDGGHATARKCPVRLLGATPAWRTQRRLWEGLARLGARSRDIGA